VSLEASLLANAGIPLMDLFRVPELRDLPIEERNRLWAKAMAASRESRWLAPRMIYVTLIPTMLGSFFVGWLLYEALGAMVLGGLGTAFGMWLHGLIRTQIVRKQLRNLPDFPRRRLGAC
jgi:hypothetical protein